jgi:pilus assembly protein CpaE
MIKFALKGGEQDAAPVEAGTPEQHIAPVPRISIQAFCESAETAAAMQAAGEDRRMAKAHLKVQMGGIAAATEAYRASATPNVVIIESQGRGETLLAGLDTLAEVCDAGTRVVVVGHLNDVVLYREMVRRGVSDYLIAPIETLDLIRAVSGLFHAIDAKPVGRTLAVVGAKGGVGASTVAHNIAWAIARDVHLDAVVADLDLPFGTAGLDFNQDPPQGIADAVMSPDRIDTAFVDRLLSKCTEHLSLLAAPATLDKVYDFGTEAFDTIYDVLRSTAPCIVLDVPHLWTGWAKRTLVAADDILIVAAPDLANLRNTKNLMDLLRAARPNDSRPQYCLNTVGVPKRPEIKPADFAKALECEPLAAIPFDPQVFGTAANNGQMIAEVSSGHRAAETFRMLAQSLTGRAEVKRSRGGSLLTPLIEKLKRRQA